ncbi:MAG: hypothetical protein ACRYF4_00765 [Janthinobacterium lividum]
MKGLSLALLVCACVSLASAQGKPTEAVKPPTPRLPSADDHQKAMQADVDRLLQLARQLKAEVDSSRKDELSIKVIRDADEIDKLARAARGRITR